MEAKLEERYGCGVKTSGGENVGGGVNGRSGGTVEDRDLVWERKFILYTFEKRSFLFPLKNILDKHHKKQPMQERGFKGDVVIRLFSGERSVTRQTNRGAKVREGLGPGEGRGTKRIKKQ